MENFNKLYNNIINESMQYKRWKTIEKNSDDIAKMLFDNIDKIKTFFDIDKTDIEYSIDNNKDMFKVSIEQRPNRAQQTSNTKGRGRRFTGKTAPCVVIKWWSVFFKKDREKEFFNLSEFNEFLKNI